MDRRPTQVTFSAEWGGRDWRITPGDRPERQTAGKRMANGQLGIGPWGGAVRLGRHEGAGAGRRIWLWDAQQQAVESCHGGVVSAGVHVPDWLEAKATKSLSDGSAARGAAEALHRPASTEPRARRENRTREWRERPEQRNCGCWLPCASTPQTPRTQSGQAWAKHCASSIRATVRESYPCLLWAPMTRTPNFWTTSGSSFRSNLNSTTAPDWACRRSNCCPRQGEHDAVIRGLTTPHPYILPTAPWPPPSPPTPSCSWPQRPSCRQPSPPAPSSATSISNKAAVCPASSSPSPSPETPSQRPNQ